MSKLKKVSDEPAAVFMILALPAKAQIMYCNLWHAHNACFTSQGTQLGCGAPKHDTEKVWNEKQQDNDQQHHVQQSWQGQCQSSGYHSKAGLEVPALHCPGCDAGQWPKAEDRTHNSPLLQPTNDKLH